MPAKFEINVGRIIKWYEKRLKEGIDESTQLLKEEIDRNTPEDTKTLIWNNEIVPAKQVWDTIVGSVKNETEYWVYVEFWIWGKSFNYNKPKWTIFKTWVWARMFTKGADNSTQEIKKIIRKNLQKWLT